ncbi:MAG: amidohydrolase family protein, partial [Nitrospinota bacterium]
LPVHHNRYMKLYAALEERRLPLAFHGGYSWENPSMAQLNRFIGVHSLGFVFWNMVHLTNWVLNGLPERFPDLKVLWIESGLAWVPFMMQRLDNEYMMRTSEAPLLRRPPSEYIREMFFSSQPMERTDLRALERTFEMIRAETQLLYASDWPHWDFDLPSAVFDLPFLSEGARRNILGESALKLFRLDRPKDK